MNQELVRNLSQYRVAVVGAGLAGSQCALTLARFGVRVDLFEMRPHKQTGAHHTDKPAELVCSNSFKSMQAHSAAGTLKYELDLLGCELLSFAREAQVAAGGALAVDRHVFSGLVEAALEANPLITRICREIKSVQELANQDGCYQAVVIAAGPLCSESLAHSIQELTGDNYLAFYDAAAPIVEAASLDHSKLVVQSRYGEVGEGDYLNALMDKEQYERLITELVNADRVIARDFERMDLFQACQPVEEIAKTGMDSLRFGALKPVGLVDPQTGKRPWAAVQLRAEDEHKQAYNLVGFQTNLTFPEQDRIFRMIPGLEEAVFVRRGVMHRNTFLQSPRLLDSSFALRFQDVEVALPVNVRFAGQITGTEGYVEAFASGLFVALNTIADFCEKPALVYPRETVQGALFAYATSSETSDYQPMHVNFGLMPPLEKKLKKKERYEAYHLRAVEAMKAWVAEQCWLFDSSDTEGN